MTQTEYLQIVGKSNALQELSKELQEKILACTDPLQMKIYLDFLKNADADLLKAKKEFLSGAKDAVKKMKDTKKTEYGKIVKKMEVHVMQKDLTAAEELLKKM